MAHRLTRIAAAALAVPVLVLSAAVPAYATTAIAVRAQPGPPPQGWHLSPTTPSATTTAAATEATAAESTGVVLIYTEVEYGAGEAAGTGLVLTSDGIVVTNHHVVEGSTEVEVTDPASDRTYTAEVLGYDAETDVAVLQLEDAGGLATIDTDTSEVAVGDEVTAVGNSDGGGVLTAADGEVTDTSSDITVSTDDGGTEQLEDLIEIDATVVSGDSGGALLDDDGEVIGMNVAASSSGTTGYAIPIETVLDIADQILDGDDSGAVTLGYGAALGVQLDTRTGELLVVGVVEGTAADEAGITAGSVITALDGSEVTGYADLTEALASHDPGDEIALSWVDAGGTAHTETVALGRAPLA